MPIKPLPGDVIAQIKSSTTITSLNGVVVELLRNALDGDATKVTIGLDYTRGNCSVEDDGLGILPSEFVSSGGLGKLHFTSRYPPQPETHGRHGTFLASLAALSLLTITSRHSEFHSYNSVQLHNARVIARHTPAPPELRLVNSKHGTRVVVRDLFGSMPVRVKQRPTSGDSIAFSREWDLLRSSIAAVVLACPARITLSVHDSYTKKSLSFRAGTAPTRVLSEKGDGSALASRVAKILVQGGLADEDLADTWVPLRASAGDLFIAGAVSLTPVATKRAQFISIGIQPVPNDSGTNVLYEEVNRLFTDSSFGVEDEGSDFEEDTKVGRARNGKRDYTQKELRGRKGVDRWPMFYIRIFFGGKAARETDLGVDEVLDERFQNLTTILNVLNAVIVEFLKKHHFLSSTSRTSKPRPRLQHSSRVVQATRPDATGTNADFGPPSALSSRASSRSGSSNSALLGDLATTKLRIQNRRTSSISESPFDGWSRIKSGRPLSCPPKNVSTLSGQEDPKGEPERDSVVTSSLPLRNFPPLIQADGKLMRPPFFDGESAMMPSTEASSHSNRTGPDSSRSLTSGPPVNQPVIATVYAYDVEPELSDEKKGIPNSEGHRWLSDLQSKWTNPVFEPAGSAIPTVSTSLGMQQTFFTDVCSHDGHSLRSTERSLQGIAGRVSKGALQDAQVIAQVDKKFILAKLPLSQAEQTVAFRNTSSLLVIIDQHAADERVRVEALMRDYFESESSGVPSRVVARTQLLGQPLRFEISTQEQVLLERHGSNFAFWGIGYHVHCPKQVALGSHARPSLKVTRLPPSIAERCVAEPRLVIELIRKEAWKFDEQAHGHLGTSSATQTGPSRGSDQELHWLSRFHGCPQGLLDLINSRACRSAIMFNDVLSADECKTLLAGLAECALPFQCAHGRPSLVPLLDLNGGSEVSSGQEGRGREFRSAFLEWKASRSQETV